MSYIEWVTKVSFIKIRSQCDPFRKWRKQAFQPSQGSEVLCRSKVLPDFTLRRCSINFLEHQSNYPNPAYFLDLSWKCLQHFQPPQIPTSSFGQTVLLEFALLYLTLVNCLGFILF